MPTATHARTPKSHRRRGISPVIPGLLITAIILGAVVAFSPGDNMRTLRRLIGFGPDYGEGSYTFMHTDRATGEPIGYSPCRTIEVVVNPEGAPGNWESLVDTAISHISGPTGLEFERVGTTERRDLDGGFTWTGEYPPVLVAWATPEEYPDLEGNVAGVGGSAAVPMKGGKSQYVTGQIVLDAELFAELRDPSEAQAIVDHEFGHLVGLDHVKDAGELMYSRSGFATTWGPGDLEGLDILGDLGC